MVESKSLKRGLKILDLFNLNNSELGVTEVSRQLQISKGTVSRLMNALESENLLKRNDGTRKFTVGKKVLRLSGVYLLKTDLKEIASPYLKELSKLTNELILLHVIKDDKRYCVDWIESANPIRHVIEKDHVYAPLHAGAAGKLLLAFLPDAQIDAIIKKTGLPKFTDNTISNAEDLKIEIEKIRKSGLAVSKGEHVKHALTVSAPVRNWTGQVVAALSISWLAIEDTPEKETKYSNLVLDVSAGLSRDLGCFEVLKQ